MYIKYFTYMQEEDKKIPLGGWRGMIFAGGFMMQQRKTNCLRGTNLLIYSQAYWDILKNNKNKLLRDNIMEDYELTMRTIKYYKNKACEVARHKCDKCEAAQEYNGKLWCAFDTVNRFIEYANKHRLLRKE